MQNKTSKYEFGNWACRFATEDEAKEIIARALASGAINPTDWGGDGANYGWYGVKAGKVFYGAKREWNGAPTFTLEQLRKKFPLPHEQRTKLTT